MKKGLLILFIILFLSPTLRAESQFLSILEDWSQKAKYGGELRLRAEFYRNYDLDYIVEPSLFQDDFLLTRERLFLDVPFSEKCRLFLNVQDAHIHETRNPINREPEWEYEDRLDLHEAFLDIKPWDNIDLTFRLGRQELSYGDERLIGDDWWGPLGRTFQGGKVIFKHGSMQLDLFAVNKIFFEDNHANNPNTDDDFYGAYWSMQNLFPHTTSQLYFLVRDIDDEDTEIYTFGIRHEGSKGSVDYAMEFAYQSGEFQSLDHRAWAAIVGAGYTFKDWRLSPRIGIEGAFASGDKNPQDGSNETFDPLFSSRGKYGYLLFFSLRNLTKVSIQTSVNPRKKVKVFLDFHFFFLSDEDDIWYDGFGVPIRQDPTGDASKHVADEVDLVILWDVMEKISIEGGISRLLPGEYMDDTGSEDPSQYVYLMTTFRF